MGFLSDIRKLYIKYWLVPTTLLGFVGGLGAHAIYKSVKQERPPIEVFFEYNKYVCNNIHSFISLPLTVCYETKHQLQFQQNKNQVSFEELAKSIEHPKTIRGLEELIVKDKANTFTEIPFQITLNYDGDDKPFLNFYEKTNTFNERNARLLLKHRNNPAFILDFIRSNEEHYKRVTGISEQFYNRVTNLIENVYSLRKSKVEGPLELIRKNFVVKDVENKRRNLGMILADLYIQNSDNWCIPDTKTLKDFYWGNFLKFRGKFIGEGHIHLLDIEGPEPSPTDIESSRKVRQLVFAETPQGVKLYDLINGDQKVLYIKGLKTISE